MAIRLGLTGDVMLGRLVDERQRRRPPAAVWGDLTAHLRKCDLLLINLECCLSTRGSPWEQTYRPFHFRADPQWAIPALDAADIDVCCLANNHVLDYGEVALRDTLEALDEAQVQYVGAGLRRETAIEPIHITAAGTSVAIVAFTDNTPEYAATESRPGTAHIDIDVTNEATRETVRTALELARRPAPDTIIASLHWGPNMVERPPDRFCDFAHWLIDEGVDVIHGHSAHIFQGIEIYKNRPILYDTGDFVDDYAVDPQARNDRSFLFDVTLEQDGAPSSLRLHPTEISACQAGSADGESAAWIRDRMRSLSRPFGTRFEREGEALVTSV